MTSLNTKILSKILADQIQEIIENSLSGPKEASASHKAHAAPHSSQDRAGRGRAGQGRAGRSAGTPVTPTRRCCGFNCFPRESTSILHFPAGQRSGLRNFPGSLAVQAPLSAHTSTWGFIISVVLVLSVARRQGGFLFKVPLPLPQNPCRRLGGWWPSLCGSPLAAEAAGTQRG